MDNEKASAQSARSWMVSRGYIHPANLVVVDTMKSELAKLEQLINTTQNRHVLRAAESWSIVWTKKLEREEREFGVPSGQKKTTGRSTKKNAKAEASKAEFEAKRSKQRTWSKPNKGQR